MLKQHLPSNHIQLIEHCDTWQESITICAQPLLQDHSIEPSYLTSIIDQYNETGPYFVIAPRIALPHARPEQGANKQGLSLLVVKDGVDFHSDNDPIHLVIMFCSTDNQTHLSMLASLANFLSDDDAVERMIAAESVEQIVHCIEQHT